MNIPPALRPAIARAILDDEAGQDGEHLFDGERIVFYCPMQAPDAAGRPDGIAVRDLLPGDSRIPTFGDYLARTRPDLRLTTLSSAERSLLRQTFERETIAWLVTLLARGTTAPR